MRMQTGTHMVPKHPWMWQARIRDDTHELVQNMLGADGGRRGPPWANPQQRQLLYTHTHTNTHTHTHTHTHITSDTGAITQALGAAASV